MVSCFVIWVFANCIGVYSKRMWMSADIMSPHLEVPSAAAAAAAADGDLDDGGDHSLIVSRGRDILTSTQTETGHYRDITVKLEAFSEVFVLDLKINTNLLGSTYIEKAVTNSGEVYNNVNHVMGHCYYTGDVRNRRQSTAAFSTCNGITGYFTIGNVSYHIESKSDDLKGRHRVFRNRDGDKTVFRCGTEEQQEWMSNNNKPINPASHRMKRSFLYPQDEDKVDRIIEVYVANDNSQFRARSSNLDAVYRRTKDIVNIASRLYQPLGIHLVLVGVEVWADGDPFSIHHSNANETLKSWYTYRQNSINPFHYNDNGVLITNVAFDNDLVGKSFIGTICSNRFSGSIISDIKDQTAAVAHTLVHEMAHNFGVQHDNTDAQCKCDDDECIMDSSVNLIRPATKWSSCSRTQFANSFSQGLDTCLHNVPPAIFQPTSQCGNGIVEDGEQCDCGKAPISECNNTCCNINTCQLTSSAACASGRCCDTTRCQIKSSGTECRLKSNDCDLPESCNGVEARCPTDTYKPDGTDCTNLDSAYCYQGQCRSHRSQCELLWGPGTKVSNNLCYIPNHCGIRWTNPSFVYVSCNEKDVLCGELQCQNHSNKLQHYQKNYLLKEWIASVGNSSCHSVTFDFGTGTQDPGLVPNGAKCGDRQMCVNQKCVDVIVSTTPIPTSADKDNASSILATRSITKPRIRPTATQPIETTHKLLRPLVGLRQREQQAMRSSEA